MWKAKVKTAGEILDDLTQEVNANIIDTDDNNRRVKDHNNVAYEGYFKGTPTELRTNIGIWVTNEFDKYQVSETRLTEGEII